MQRHIADAPRAREPGIRLREFTKKDRTEKRHPALKALYEKDHAPRSSSQLRHFLRIARGKQV